MNAKKNKFMDALIACFTSSDAKTKLCFKDKNRKNNKRISTEKPMCHKNIYHLKCICIYYHEITDVK